jgi:predicted dehydrogenase
MNAVGIGFAGVGFMGQVAHLRNYAHRQDCRVVAIAEPRADLAQQVAAEFGVSKIYRSHLELAADPDVQGVVASQPHLRNGLIAIPLLRAGKHVFIEKPMAGSTEEAEQIQRAADAAGVHVMVGVMKRYDTSVQLARGRLQELFASGELGALRRIRAFCFGGDWIQDAIPPITTTEIVPDDPAFSPIYPAWMDADQARQYQSYLNIMAHTINLLRCLYPKPLTVQTALAQNNNRLLHTALLSAEDGVLVEVAGGSVRAHAWQEETHFIFERGWLKLFTPSPLNRQARGSVEVYQYSDQKQAKREEMLPPIDWAFRRQADHFIECVRTGAEPLSSGRDTLHDMRLMEEIFRKMILY